MECGINDSLLNNALNLSNSGESYLFTLQKLRILCNRFPNIKYVFLEVTDNVFKKNFNKCYYADEYISNRFHLLGSSFSIRDHLFVFTKNPKGYFNATAILIRKNIELIFTKKSKNLQELGGFKSLDNILTKEKMEEIKLNIKSNPSIPARESHSLIYLNQILDFCKKSSLKIAFVRSPQNKHYNELFGHENFKLILDEKFQDIDFLDFNDSIRNDNLFADLEHLNKHGAKEYTNMFKRQIIHLELNQ